MTPTPPSGADVIASVAALSNEELVEGLDGSFAQMAAAAGNIVVALGEVSRRQAYRDEGATSTETWVVERYGVSVPSARALAQVGEKAWDLPHLVGSLCAGEVSLDKVKVLAEVATPEADRELAEAAQEHSVRQLADVARAAAAGAARAGQPSSSALRARAALRALQRGVAHHERPAARRVLRPDPGLPRGPGPHDPLRRGDPLGPAPL